MACRPHLLLLGWLSLAAVPSRAELSQETRAKISADFPAWHPNPPETGTPAARPDAPAPLSDDPLVYLPTYHVKESLLSHAGDKLRSEREVQAKALAAYKDSMTDLEWALNSWFVPLFTAPASSRAREYYEDQKTSAETARLQRLQSIKAPGD